MHSHHSGNEFLLDVSFSSDEVAIARAIQKRERKKSPGLLAEHLKAGGDAVVGIDKGFLFFSGAVVTHTFQVICRQEVCG